jgi:hypothetical protein
VTNPHYLLTLEAMPSTNGTPESRLKRALKTLAWYRLKCRSIEEVPAEPERKGGKTLAHLGQDQRSRP